MSDLCFWRKPRLCDEVDYPAGAATRNTKKPAWFYLHQGKEKTAPTSNRYKYTMFQCTPGFQHDLTKNQ